MNDECGKLFNAMLEVLFIKDIHKHPHPFEESESCCTQVQQGNRD